MSNNVDKVKQSMKSLDVMSGYSLSNLVAQVNQYNSMEGVTPITKDDIVSIIKDEGSYMLLFYR